MYSAPAMAGVSNTLSTSGDEWLRPSPINGTATGVHDDASVTCITRCEPDTKLNCSRSPTRAVTSAGRKNCARTGVSAKRDSNDSSSSCMQRRYGMHAPL